ncbi:MAG: hypothetical protein ACFFD6_08245 [Candidatus Thorarchaeota archaeon]
MRIIGKNNGKGLHSGITGAVDTEGNAHDTKYRGILSPTDIRLILGVLAFFIPYLLQVSSLAGALSVRVYAPLWAYGSIDTPIFRILSIEYLIVELPFGIVKLLFVQQVYHYMSHNTTLRKLLFYGVITEIPGTVFAYVFSVGYALTPFCSPVPILLALGLYLAVKTPEKKPMWYENQHM